MFLPTTDCSHLFILHKQNTYYVYETIIINRHEMVSKLEVFLNSSILHNSTVHPRQNTGSIITKTCNLTYVL